MIILILFLFQNFMFFIKIFELLFRFVILKKKTNFLGLID